MNNDFQNDRQDPLLDAVVGEESWRELSATVKDAALNKFSAHHCRRRAQIWLAQAALVALVASAVVWWPRTHSTPSRLPNTGNQPAPKIAATLPETVSQTPATANVDPKPASGGNVHYSSESDLLALFPQGSCTIAEVNG